jgi:Protein of unknown function (DUF3631)
MTALANDGAALLDELHATLKRFVIFPREPMCRSCAVQAAHERHTETPPLTSENAAPNNKCAAVPDVPAHMREMVSVAVTLWIAATHAQDAWEHATRLVIKSPLKRCGKSRLLDLIAELAHNVLLTVNISVAALVRTISEKDPPTILVDEADTIFAQRRGQRSEASEDLRGILNAGHQRQRPYLRWDMANRKLDECPTFAMAAIAGIGDMPDTIEDRAVVVTMRRRASDEKVSPLRRKRDIPALHAFRDRLHLTFSVNIPKLEIMESVLPVEDRAADTWEPLITIADLAGGHWPALARAACTAMTSQATSAEDTSGERLLADLKTVFANAGDETKALWTSNIIENLAEIDEAPWANYHEKRKDPKVSDRAIARLLRPYDIYSSSVRKGDKTRKGYHREDLQDAWQRYLTPSDVSENAADPDSRTTNGTAGTAAQSQSEAASSQVRDDSSCAGNVPDDDSLNGTEPFSGGQVFTNTAAWDAAGRPGLSTDPEPTHRCARCGKTGSPPRMVAAYPHSGCGGLWTPA